MFTWGRQKFGEWLAAYLNQPVSNYLHFSVTPARILRDQLRPGDILLVEGDKRISVAIKYLTQSTWSHAALYVGNVQDERLDAIGNHSLIEADLKEGVLAVPLSKYSALNTRICRPVNLTNEDREQLIQFAVDQADVKYDLKHIFDLLRYLLPKPPVPSQWRRQMLSLGSGNPTRTVCSTLIAQAFQSIQYPILPKIRQTRGGNGEDSQKLYQERYYRLFTPRDFDLSPYFQVVKPTLEGSFNYKSIEWYEDPNDPDPAYRQKQEDSV